MSGDPITYRPIGIVRSEHKIVEKTPIQPVFAKGCPGYAKLYPEYAEGLRDLNGFSHIYLIYHFHQAGQAQMIVKPFLQDTECGIFSTRAPCRPNPIGLSVVELIKIADTVLYFDGADILDGTPLLDIKPYRAKFDLHDVKKSGWLDEVDDQAAWLRGKRMIATP